MSNLNQPSIEIDLPDAGWKFENSYAKLPEAFFARSQPAAFSKPTLYILNNALAAELGLQFEGISNEHLARLFSGQWLPEGSEPIAQAYAGHQFGGFTFLGDGRAILLGEHRTPDGRLIDIQFKGSGQTVFSRRGDGRAALGPMLREYIISEAMHALGIPTTRSLAVATTGEPVYREKMLRGAVLTRTAASHLRVGTFQYIAARKDHENLKILADYAIARHYPELINVEEKYLAFLNAVAHRQVSLIAQWQAVGFIHGVMNTDNMAISGESIDYGPCAFMNSYHPETVFSSIDDYGRYAYGNQPVIAQWNLARFAETLLPLLHPHYETSIEIATKVIHAIPQMYQSQWLKRMACKIGIESPVSGDEGLIQTLLDWMQKNKLDFTNTFRDLGSVERLQTSLYNDQEFIQWRRGWEERLAKDGGSISAATTIMNQVNPVVIPRNHRVEEALAACELRDDIDVLHRLLKALHQPFDDSAEHNNYRDPPPADQTCYQTFCGT
jgi:serine/tyrosine/threonine adenylyltransferase